MTVDQSRQMDIHGSALAWYLSTEVAGLMQRRALINELEIELLEYYDALGAEGREEDQDAVADVLDSLTGFCSPSTRDSA